MMTEQFQRFHELTRSGINNGDEITVLAVDNFYNDPDGIREFTINNVNQAEKVFLMGGDVVLSDTLM